MAWFRFGPGFITSWRSAANEKTDQTSTSKTDYCSTWCEQHAMRDSPHIKQLLFLVWPYKKHRPHIKPEFYYRYVCPGSVCVLYERKNHFSTQHITELFFIRLQARFTTRIGALRCKATHIVFETNYCILKHWRKITTINNLVVRACTIAVLDRKMHAVPLCIQTRAEIRTMKTIHPELNFVHLQIYNRKHQTEYLMFGQLFQFN